MLRMRVHVRLVMAQVVISYEIILHVCARPFLSMAKMYNVNRLRRFPILLSDEVILPLLGTTSEARPWRKFRNRGNGQRKCPANI